MNETHGFSGRGVVEMDDGFVGWLGKGSVGLQPETITEKQKGSEYVRNPSVTSDCPLTDTICQNLPESLSERCIVLSP